MKRLLHIIFILAPCQIRTKSKLQNFFKQKLSEQKKMLSGILILEQVYLGLFDRILVSAGLMIYFR